MGGFFTSITLKYFDCNGLNMLDTINATQEAEDYCRLNRSPVFLHMKTVR